MTYTNFFNAEWANGQINTIKVKAQNRYREDLNINTVTTTVFDSIQRNTNFKNELTNLKDNLKKINLDLNTFNDTKINEKDKFVSLKESITKLSTLIQEIICNQTTIINWKLINNLATQAYNTFNDFGKEISIKDKIKVEEIRNISFNLLPIIRFTESESDTSIFSNAQFVLLTGEGGVGKTHLLCETVINQLKNNKNNAVIIFGEYLGKTNDIWSEIIRQLNLPSSNNPVDDLFYSLNQTAVNNNDRALFIIDALNETQKNNYWNEQLPLVINKIKKYPNIVLVISITTGYELILNQEIQKVFEKCKHSGFRSKIWAAMKLYFDEYQIPLSDIPVLNNEFENPLFLNLYCESINHKIKNNKKNLPEDEIFKGHVGFTYIFEHYIKALTKSLAKQFNLPQGKINGAHLIWDSLFDNIAAHMIDKNTTKISEKALLELINNKIIDNQ